ncbi:MAG TPA: HNH endonuclease signature motif containing protein [Tepidisphaeraceae bacterium]|nr:HNH endonuclease signature motif containing protein [Tepidisphaeraceae bacterium]
MVTESERRQVRMRAGDRCEYCHLPQAGHDERFSVDHVIARKHGGADGTDNLAFCCLRCNLHKGTDLTGIAPDSGEVVLLFHPRRDRLEEHFEFVGATIRGRTAIGATTVRLLQVNAPEHVRLRESLQLEGLL